MYLQSTGELFDGEGLLVGTGYSGAGIGRNNPALDSVHNVGPIPAGEYTIGAPEDLAGGPHGPFVLRLEPDPANNMHGRDGFLIHGDAIARPGSASHGCIILPRRVRERIALSGDDRLKVE